MQNKVTKVLIWLGFISFLSSSIPHVAYVFHAFEGTDTSTFGLTVLGFNLFTVDKWWFLSYLEAISIDVLIAWLSHVLTSGKAMTDKGIGYTFIVILVTISWFFNWIYAKSHAPIDTGIWSHSLIWGLVQMRTVTPIITSALPVFAIGYAVMLSKLTNTVTADELKAHLEEKKQIADIKRQFSVGESKLTSFLKRGMTEVKDVTTFAQTTFKEGTSTEIVSGQSEDNSEIVSGQSEDTLEIVSGLADDTVENDTLQNSLGSARNVTLEQASILLTLDIKTVKRLITQGRLKTPSTSDSLVTRPSIEGYLESKRVVRRGKTRSNGHLLVAENDTEALSLPLLIGETDSSLE
jgi:hypothetical protein